MWIEQLRRRLSRSSQKSAARGYSRSAKLQFENLEARTVPAVFKVTSLLDNTNPVITAGHTGTPANPYLAPSLRSAISAANATKGGNTIELAVPGDYKIAIPGANEDNNATGDFDILASGGNLTITNTSGGVAIVDGNHLDRVFDINPNPNPATAPFTVTLEGFTIQNGYVNSSVAPAGSGGGIRDSGNASLTLTNMVIQNNTAHDGGGIAFANSVSAPWVLTVNTSKIEDNRAANNGGGIETDGSGLVNIDAGTTIAGNTAYSNGGGIWLNDIDGVISVQVTDNSAVDYLTPPTVTFTPADVYGGGAAGTAILSNGKVVGVQITNRGSGYDKPPIVSFSGGDPNLTAVATIAFKQATTLNVTAATISNNSCNAIGGGIGNSGNSAVTIANSTIAYNTSIQNGGGYGDVHYLDTLTVQNSLFEGNVADQTGGAISATGANATIENSTFLDNTGVYGGAVYSSTNILLTNDLFTENTAIIQGGGIEAYGGLTTGTNLEFIDNTTGIYGNGGGIFFVGTTLRLTSSTFSGNTSSLNGGGLEFEGNGSGAQQSTITNSTFIGNTAINLHGGGIDFEGGTGSLALINDTIDGNVAVGSGGGVYWSTSSLTGLEIENTIIAGNSGGTGGDLVNPTGQIQDLGGNLIGNSTGSAGFAAKTTQLAVDPLLGTLGNNGGPKIGSSGNSMTLETQSLGTGSPAIGKGVLTLTPPADDERGDLRPSFIQGTALDVGAFETQAIAPQSHSTVPAKGDTNPYGVAYVPSNFPTGGIFKPGALIVTNFNNAAGTQGTGTTLVQINPTGAPTTLFTSKQAGLDAALGFLKAGFVIVGNVPNVNGTPESGSLQILNKYGQVVETLANSTFLDGPWSLTVANDTGSSAQVFVSNVLNGTVTRLNLSIQNGTVKVASMTEIASGYAHLVSPAAFVVGPAGLAYDAATGVLYVASSADDSIYALANAASLASGAGPGSLVAQSNFLHGPLGLVIAPNGNLLVANSDATNVDPDNPSEISEFTTNGQFVAQFSIDPANGGAFGLAVQVTNGKLTFAAVDDNTNTIDTWAI